MGDTESLELFISQVDAICEVQRGGLLIGHVIAIDASGAVVDLGLKRDGIISRSDLDRLPDDEAQLDVGDEVSVMVINPIDADGNLVVSLSQARESRDWLKAKRLMEKDEVIEALPTGFNRGGLIVPFGRLRGFVPASHISDMPRGLEDIERAEHLQRLVGLKMPLKVLEVDPMRHRLVLSERKAIRQWRAERKAKVIDALQEGEIRKGIVKSIQDFGVFVDIGGADGLIHISELSWEHVDDPAEMLQIDQEIETLIIRLDQRANRIGLSLKRLQPNPWIEASERIQPDMVLEGRVTRCSNSGFYVAVDGLIEGHLRCSGEQPLPEEGMTIQVRVLTFDAQNERMSLELAEEKALVP